MPLLHHDDEMVDEMVDDVVVLADLAEENNCIL